MTLRRLLRLLAALLILASASLVLRIATADWQHHQRAREGQAALANLRKALVAAEMASRERGPANGVMGDDQPVQPQRQVALAEARARTDTAFVTLHQVFLDSVADARHGNAARQLARADTALRNARARVDQVAALPKAERSPDALGQSVAAMASVVPLTAPSISLMAEMAQEAVPTLGDAVQGAHITAELREYAGLLGSHFTAALTRQQPFSSSERMAIERTRGRIEQLRFLLALRLDRPGAPARAHAAWQQVEQLYFGRADALVVQVVAAGARDGNFGLDPAAFATAYVPDMNSMFALRDLLLDDATARAEAQARQALLALWLTAAVSLGLLALLAATLLLVQRRLLGPLHQTAQALQRLAQNDLLAPLPRARADDEMAAVIGAVGALQAQTRQRQTLEQERDVLIERLRTLSNTDFLTGLPNRRAFMQSAERELAQARRHGVAMSLVLLDVDHFKQFNDRHGHAAGDQALVAVAETVRRAMRSGDLVARLGGEEFVLLLSHCDSRQGLAFAERLRGFLAGTPVACPGGEQVQVTASLGVAQARSDLGDANLGDANLGDANLGGAELEMLLQQADAAMYRAKQTGRNRVAAAV